MAVRTPGGEKHAKARVSYPGFHAAIFSGGFPSRHSRGRLSEDSLTSSTNDESIQKNKHPPPQKKKIKLN